MPQLDSPSTGAQDGDLSQLAVDYAQVRQQLTDAQNRLQQLQLADAASDSSRRPGAPTPPRPAEVLPYVPPAPPPPAFQFGMLSGTQGLAEIFVAMSVAYSAMKIPSVLATPVHAFPMPAGASAALIYQKTASHHHHMYNYFELKLKPLPTTFSNYLSSRQKPFPATWEDLSGALAAIARQHQDKFGTSAACQLADMLRLFDEDIEELRRLAASAQHPVAINQRVTDVCISAFRDGNAMIVPRVITNEIGSIRQELNRQLLRAPGQQRGGRGRAGGEYSGDPPAPAPAGKAGGRGKGGSSRSGMPSTAIGYSEAHGTFIRKAKP
jgi:hypothetical protein